MKLSELTKVATELAAARRKAMFTKRVVSSQRPALVKQLIEGLEGTLERLRAL